MWRPRDEPCVAVKKHVLELRCTMFARAMCSVRSTATRLSFGQSMQAALCKWKAVRTQRWPWTFIHARGPWPVAASMARLNVHEITFPCMHYTNTLYT